MAWRTPLLLCFQPALSPPGEQAGLAVPCPAAPARPPPYRRPPPAHLLKGNLGVVQPALGGGVVAGVLLVAPQNLGGACVRSMAGAARSRPHACSPRPTMGACPHM